MSDDTLIHEYWDRLDEQFAGLYDEAMIAAVLVGLGSDNGGVNLED